ncbi:winged helix-turn-helix transcriptional regulator [Methanocaldococcus indicus]|uniref:winged helix-turn-helix transcriptional regulator n=1 Tax=Methanocaldococcus indicus TaxID=213231 RepID=UPI003C6CE2D8
MDILKILTKKYNKAILFLLEKYGTLHYSAIKKSLNNVHDHLLTKALDELVEAGLIKRELENPNIRPSRVLYSLTDLGKMALNIYSIAKKIEDSRIKVIGNNNIIINNVSSSNINIKK